jgi:N-methylhydantoinase A
VRLAVDTGGTFTDLVIDDGAGPFRLFKSATVPHDPAQGVLDVLDVAAAGLGRDRAELLAEADVIVHGTTHAINAVLTGTTARTAFLTTAGHPDVLLLREGGRMEPFNFTRAYPDAYVPRSLTFEVPERIGADGEVVLPLDEGGVARIAARLRELEVEAVGVCLLWSVINPEHELRVGELLARLLPGIPVTLSHEINPTLREYRRASAACIDASLKPLMQAYLGGLTRRLADAGFAGRVLVVSSIGGVLDADRVARAPIHAIGSGPALAPVAGAMYAAADAGTDTAIVADTGGTSYDVSLVRGGRIPTTRETWLGEPFAGHMTGFASVDVKSIGAGGGSVAWIDDGGLLHVGPRSAGSVPGPACYGRGGREPTVTDAAVVLGHLDPAFFLGGAMRLDRAAAVDALDGLAGRLGIPAPEAAAAVLTLATEQMVGAIEEIVLYQGVDPRDALLVGGGGAAGLNVVAIARRLGCRHVVVPAVGAALSAVGGLLSELASDHAATFPATSTSFDAAGVAAVLDDLTARAQRFIAEAGAGASESAIDLSVEARYPQQIWELEVPIDADVGADGYVDRLCEAFHATHERVFAISDPGSPVEFLAWRARGRCRVGRSDLPPAEAAPDGVRGARRAFFAGAGFVDAITVRFEGMDVDESVAGPAIVESATTTVVLDPGSTARRTASGSLSIRVEPAP